MKYWDSSALVALIVEEPASAERRALLRQDHRIVTWWGSWIECAAAVNRLHREGGIDGAELGQSLELLQRLAATIGWKSDRWSAPSQALELLQRSAAATWMEVRPLERVQAAGAAPAAGPSRSDRHGRFVPRRRCPAIGPSPVARVALATAPDAAHEPPDLSIGGVSVGRASEPRYVIVSSDARLSTAAQREGFLVV